MMCRALRLSITSDETRRLVADPEAVAASLRDPARRDEVQRIVARLEQQGQGRPDDAESVRPKHGDRKIWHVAVQNSYLK